MITSHSNYRHYLRDVLTERIAHNRSYSLRAFARDIGIAPSTMTEILKGKRNLSSEKAYAVAHKLRLSERDIEYFCLLVQFDSARQSELREAIQSKMHLLQPTEKSYDLSVDHFKLIADWYHLVILETLNADDFDPSPPSIARRLGITAVEVEAAIERLIRLELVERTADGGLKKTKNRLLSTSSIPSEALRKFHRQMLEKAVESLETQTPKEKVVGSETLPFDSSQIEEVRKLCDDFFNRLIKLSSRGKKRKDVYHVGVQFFNLTKSPGASS